MGFIKGRTRGLTTRNIYLFKRRLPRHVTCQCGPQIVAVTKGQLGRKLTDLYGGRAVESKTNFVSVGGVGKKGDIVGARNT